MKYEIVGAPFSVVVCELEAGEKVKTEMGSMAWMDPVFQMETSGGVMKKMFGKMMSGEGLFENIYTATSAGKIAFGSSFPGSIMPVDISPGNEVIVQKSSFLASDMGVDISIFFNRKLGAGFFGGEGFVMQKLSGNGKAFLEIDGSFIEYELPAGQQLIVDTGNVMGFTGGVTMDIQQVKGIKNKLLGGEGIFNTRLTGPGTVWIQTMPMASFVESIMPFIQPGNK